MRKVLLGLAIASSALLADGASVYSAQCSSCHGAKANESLAGNPVINKLGEAKIVDAMLGYKSGKIKGDTMSGVAAGLSEADIKAVAGYIATLK